MFYKYLMAIRKSPKFSEENWVSEFNKQFQFNINEFDNGKIGQLQYLHKNEVEEKFKDAPWLKLKNPCPYLGEIIGYLNWEWWQGLWEYKATDDYNEREEMLLEWHNMTNGFIFRIDNHHYFDFIKELTYPLEDITSTHGFEQGQVFLKNVENVYWKVLQKTVLDKLKQKGVTAHFNSMRSTGRNELYISDWIPREIFQNEQIKFWGLDIDLTTDQAWKEFLND